MIEDQRIQAYIESLGTGNGSFLDELEEACIRDSVPIIRPSMQSLLKVLIGIKDPGSILEVGTATGFSAILMASASSEDCRITTIEKYEKRIPLARDNIARSGYGDRIRLIAADAKDVLKDLAFEGCLYDMIFMDAAKGQYLNFLEDSISLLNDGGMLISDNVLQDGDIVQSRFAVTRRNRTIHSRMREYLYILSHDDRLTTTVLPVGDGVTVSVKKGF
ncbi:MAG: O-methyltransferase [Lachnospiraceae bacterium]|nr:O-methyltransferase [Lachnospiraceae bacterium]